MKRLIFSIAIFLILISFTSAIIITEVEINPNGGANGDEWVEIYNNEGADVEISGWTIKDSAGQIFRTINADTWIKNKEYLVLEYSGANSLLNNPGDFVTLYNHEGKKVDETPELEELTISEKTWQLCDRDWVFLEETKGIENDCEEDSNVTSDDEDDESDDEDSDGESNDGNDERESSQIIEINASEDEIERAPVTFEAINLNPKDIKDKNDKDFLQKNWPVISLVIFCVFLGLLLVLRRLKYKNEFRD